MIFSPQTGHLIHCCSPFILRRNSLKPDKEQQKTLCKIYVHFKCFKFQIDTNTLKV